MTVYEIVRGASWPFLPVLHSKASRTLRDLVRESVGSRCRVLDVGGRRSPYTIALAADVTVLDIPRSGDVRSALDLGVTDELLRTLRRKRSNIHDVVIQDMTRCTLPDAGFDGVVAVEVIEHVTEDESFVAHMARVLKPGGWAFLTTPNGDVVPNRNPDHVRHYTRQALHELLGRHFAEVSVEYGITISPARSRGLKSISLRHPVTAAATAVGNVINHVESRRIRQEPEGMAHLFALVRSGAAGRGRGATGTRHC